MCNVDPPRFKLRGAVIPLLIRTYADKAPVTLVRLAFSYVWDKVPICIVEASKGEFERALQEYIDSEEYADVPDQRKAAVYKEYHALVTFVPSKV